MERLALGITRSGNDVSIPPFSWKNDAAGGSLFLTRALRSPTRTLSDRLHAVASLLPPSILSASTDRHIGAGSAVVFAQDARRMRGASADSDRLRTEVATAQRRRTALTAACIHPRARLKWYGTASPDHSAACWLFRGAAGHHRHVTCIRSAPLEPVATF